MNGAATYTVILVIIAVVLLGILGILNVAAAIYNQRCKDSNKDNKQ